MADAPAPWTARLVAALVGVVVLVGACADGARTDEVGDVLAQLRSAEPAQRYEAVVRLGMLPPSQARRDGLAGAVRDEDQGVRLMAAIVVIGDGPTEHASWLRSPPAVAGSASTPNPAPREDLSPAEDLVRMDAWFAGTLKPAALLAARDGDERVRALANRALESAK